MAAREEIHRLREENQALRDEVARLKGHKGKPSIGPSRLNPGERPKRRGRRRRPRPERRIDSTQKVTAQGVPAGSVFKGHTPFDVQELVIQVETTRYLLEKWLTPEGRVLTARLPAAVSDGRHFGTMLQSFILYQHYHCQVTEPLLREMLAELGVEISAGQLHRLITKGKERFGCRSFLTT